MTCKTESRTIGEKIAAQKLQIELNRTADETKVAQLTKQANHLGWAVVYSNWGLVLVG